MNVIRRMLTVMSISAISLFTWLLFCYLTAYVISSAWNLAMMQLMSEIIGL